MAKEDKPNFKKKEDKNKSNRDGHREEIAQEFDQKNKAKKQKNKK